MFVLAWGTALTEVTTALVPRSTNLGWGSKASYIHVLVRWGK